MKLINKKYTKDIEEVARKEFLAKGYENSSLRDIVAKCGISTQIIYNRYGSKEGLFDALVAGTANEFFDKFKEIHSLESDNIDQLIDNSSLSTDWVLDYIYENFEDFKLIFCYSAGTKYEHYFEDLVKIEENYMVKMLSNNLKKDLDLNSFFIHKKATDGMQSLYQIVAHDVKKEDALSFMELEKRFRFAGWREILK